MTETTRTLTPFEAFELEIWGLRNAFDRNRTVPILLDFAVRQREHSLADAVEATLQIYRRYRERYRKDAPSTSKTSMLIPEIEAYSNGLRTEDKDALVTLPGSDGGEVNYVVDSDLFREVDGAREYPWRDREPAPAPDAADVSAAWATAVERVAAIGVSVDYYGAGRTADRSGAFTCRIRGGQPGLAPQSPLTPEKAWYQVRLHEGLTDAERLAVLGEILGYIFLGYAPQVWSGGAPWTNKESLVPEAPATSHWWIAPESRAKSAETPGPLLRATSRSFTDMEARQAMLAGAVGAARAGLIPHLASDGELGSPGRVLKDMRWVPVLQAAVQIEDLLSGTMHPPVAAPPTGKTPRGFDEA